MKSARTSLLIGLSLFVAAQCVPISVPKPNIANISPLKIPVEGILPLTVRGTEFKAGFTVCQFSAACYNQETSVGTRLVRAQVLNSSHAICWPPADMAAATNNATIQLSNDCGYLHHSMDNDQCGNQEP